jgi:hypothetical protein
MEGYSLPTETSTSRKQALYTDFLPRLGKVNNEYIKTSLSGGVPTICIATFFTGSKYGSDTQSPCSKGGAVA